MRISILLFLCLNGLFVMSQEENTENAFELAVDDLHEGGLIVLLPTKSKAIAAMGYLNFEGTSPFVQEPERLRPKIELNRTILSQVI